MSGTVKNTNLDNKTNVSGTTYNPAITTKIWANDWNDLAATVNYLYDNKLDTSTFTTHENTTDAHHTPTISSDIDHLSIQNIGVYNHEQIDTHMDTSSIHEPNTDAIASVSGKSEGDLFVWSGSDLQRLAIGTDGYILTVDAAGYPIWTSGASGGVSSHNALSGIQGGLPNEYYHLNNTKYTYMDASGSIQTQLDSKASQVDLITHTAITDAHHVKTVSADIDHTAIQNRGVNSHATIDSHLADASNPHMVNASQVGATTPTDVDDKITTHSADASAHHSKTVSADIDHTAIQNRGTNSHATIDSHLANTSNPHSVQHSQLGGIGVSDHHVRYTDAEAVSAIEATPNLDFTVKSSYQRIILETQSGGAAYFRVKSGLNNWSFMMNSSHYNGDLLMMYNNNYNYGYKFPSPGTSLYTVATTTDISNHDSDTSAHSSINIKGTRDVWLAPYPDRMTNGTGGSTYGGGSDSYIYPTGSMYAYWDLGRHIPVSIAGRSVRLNYIYLYFWATSPSGTLLLTRRAITSNVNEGQTTISSTSTYSTYNTFTRYIVVNPSHTMLTFNRYQLRISSSDGSDFRIMGIRIIYEVL